MRPVATCFVLLLCLAPGFAFARVEERSALQRIHELSASTESWPQAVSVLSSTEWSAIAPPGCLLQLVEDQPWSMLEGSWHQGMAYPGHGLTGQRLVSHTAAGGSYEAVASLRMSPYKGRRNPLRQSFDASAASMVRRAQLFPETRTEHGYVITEVRSPLGLTDSRDKENCQREYFGYQAELRNPLLDPPSEGEALYTRVNGELRVVRVVDGCHYLLTVEFSSQDYPWAISLTENIARLLLTQFAQCDEDACIPAALPYSTEWYWPAANHELDSLLDMRGADLIERPDTGVLPDGSPAPAPITLADVGGIVLPRPLELPQPAPAVRVEALPDVLRRSPAELSGMLEPFRGWIVDEQPVPAETEARVPEAQPDTAAAAPVETGNTEEKPEATSVELPAPGQAPVATDPAPAGQPAPADASVPAPAMKQPASEAPAKPALPRLFEGWGSPRSTALPASRALLDPFKGWLSDPPQKLVDRIAQEIKLRAERGR